LVLRANLDRVGDVCGLVADRAVVHADVVLLDIRAGWDGDAVVAGGGHGRQRLIDTGRFGVVAQHCDERLGGEDALDVDGSVRREQG
jgi:hypothetical protein